MGLLSHFLRRWCVNRGCCCRRRTLWWLRLDSRGWRLRRCLSSGRTSRRYTSCRLSNRLYPAQRRRPSTCRYSYITGGTSAHLAPWLGAVIPMKFRSIRSDSILGWHLRLLLLLGLLLRLLLLLLMMLVLMMMMVEVVADVDREGRMRQLIEVRTRRRRRLRLMARMHMVIVTWLRILTGMRSREMVMMGTATVRQQTMHRC